MATVTFDKAQRWYPGADKPTVPGIDLEIQDGEFMVLVGPVRVRQVHHPADARGPGGDQRRQDLHRRPRRHERAAEGPGHRDGVPELRALPAHDRRRQHGLRPQDGQGSHRGAQQAGRRGRQDPGPRGVPRAQAQGPVRWSAPARGDGPRDRPQPAGVLHGRAAVEPRREDAGADPHRHRQAPGRPRRHHRLRHPRPGRGHDDGRPGRGDEARRAHAGRHPAQPLRQAEEPVRGRLHRLAADEPHRGALQGRPGPDRRVPRAGRPDGVQAARRRARPTSPSACARRPGASCRRPRVACRWT